jgi:hypothetical protein
MARRSMIALVLAILAMLALASTALAGGWAVVTLDSLPREVRAGARFELGFMVLQHGKTPTNTNLNGDPLKPLLTATKQGEPAATFRAEARQQGQAGHYVVDLTFPSDGRWDWQIVLPTFYVQDSPNGSNAAIFAPISVLPAAVPAPAAATQQAAPASAAAAPATAPAPEATTWLGLSPAALRWAGLGALLVALVVALYGQSRGWHQHVVRPS